jgi:hypothetical protein
MPSVAAANGERRAAPGEARRGRQTERDGLALTTDDFALGR